MPNPARLAEQFAKVEKEIAAWLRGVKAPPTAAGPPIDYVRKAWGQGGEHGFEFMAHAEHPVPTIGRPLPNPAVTTSMSTAMVAPHESVASSIGMRDPRRLNDWWAFHNHPPYRWAEMPPEVTQYGNAPPTFANGLGIELPLFSGQDLSAASAVANSLKPRGSLRYGVGTPDTGAFAGPSGSFLGATFHGSTGPERGLIPTTQYNVDKVRSLGRMAQGNMDPRDYERTLQMLTHRYGGGSEEAGRALYNNLAATAPLFKATDEVSVVHNFADPEWLNVIGDYIRDTHMRRGGRV